MARSWSLVTADLSGAPLDTVDGEDIAGVLDRTLESRIGAIAWRIHRFEPRGASLVGIAARGRLIVHTWPERAALTIDLYAELGLVEAALSATVEALMAPLSAEERAGVGRALTERGGRARAEFGAGSHRRPA